MLIHHFLENSAVKHPEKIAVVHGDARVTYRDLNAKVESLAANLQANGIVKGDRIAILLENGVEYIIAYYASLKVGAVSAPLNPGLKPAGLQILLANLEPAAVITDFKGERLLKAVDLTQLPIKLLIIKDLKADWRNTPYNVLRIDECFALPTNPTNAIDAINPSDLASIIYTSGSTGEPKGVMLSHANVVANTLSICQYLHITHDDIQMVVLPFFYVMGKSLLNTHIAGGGTIVINNRFMYPADVVNQMIDERVTAFSGVPSTYAYLLNRSPLESCKEKLTSLRYCSQAGGHMAKALKLALRKALPQSTQIVIMYGATEASARLTYLPPEFFDTRIESIGIPIPGVTVSVMDNKNNEVPSGSDGMLVANGPNIMMGYWRNPEDTKRALTTHGYHTGDIGYRDSEGFLFVTARKDGLLKVGGHRVNPIEIEDFLIATDLLIETKVIGLPDDLLGIKLVAVVVPKDQACSAQQLLERCADALPSHKCPSDLIFLRNLPKNSSGKVDHQQCRAIALQKLVNR